MGCGRGLYQVAQDGVLPTWFGRLNDHGVPANAMLFNLVVRSSWCSSGRLLKSTFSQTWVTCFPCSLSLVGYFVLRRPASRNWHDR
ncbi:hypothetical protein EMGBS3_10860 [Anaerolineaceae bacterium]|nr:hypothetical protein EMGBS3_10860 [Anaerolineaceae bacterium]